MRPRSSGRGPLRISGRSKFHRFDSHNYARRSGFNCTRDRKGICGLSSNPRRATKRPLAQSESGLVRRASAWAPGEAPRHMPLGDLEHAEGVRWVDINHSELRSARSLGALNRVCEGALTQRMARDLATPRRFPAAGTYGSTSIRMTAAFLVRHLQADAPDGDTGGPVGSVLKPVQLLAGQGWLLSAWLPPRLFRGSSAALEADSDDDDPHRLHVRRCGAAGPRARAQPPTTSRSSSAASSRSRRAIDRARSDHESTARRPRRPALRLRRCASSSSATSSAAPVGPGSPARCRRSASGTPPTSSSPTARTPPAGWASPRRPRTSCSKPAST